MKELEDSTPSKGPCAYARCMGQDPETVASNCAGCGQTFCHRWHLTKMTGYFNNFLCGPCIRSFNIAVVSKLNDAQRIPPLPLPLQNTPKTPCGPHLCLTYTGLDIQWNPLDHATPSFSDVVDTLALIPFPKCATRPHTVAHGTDSPPYEAMVLGLTEFFLTKPNHNSTYIG